MWERRETQLAASLQITLIRPEQAGASAENTNLLVNNNPSQCSTSGPWPSTESMRITQSTKQCQSNTGQLRVLFINDCMEIWSNTVLHSVIETSTAMLVHNQVLGAMWEQSVQDIYSRTSKSCLDNKSWQFNSFRLKRGANKLQIKPLTYSDSRLMWSKVLRSIWLRNIISAFTFESRLAFSHVLMLDIRADLNRPGRSKAQRLTSKSRRKSPVSFWSLTWDYQRFLYFQDA